MKKTVLTLILYGISLISNSQNASVEKSIFGIQTGFLGVWGYNESKLSNQFALRTEIGLDAVVYETNINTKLAFAPTFTLEPRWYYNLNKRVAKKRNIANNSGNYVSLKTSYVPDWFVISGKDNIKVLNQLAIVPTWGIRRNLGKHFNYETGIGLGYVRYFETEGVFVPKKGEAILNLHLRIGYQF